MGRLSKTRRLNVWMNGRLTGCWEVNSNNQHQFRYSQEWIEWRGARPISLSMVLQPQNIAHQGPVVESYFENLLPDSVDIRKHIQQSYHARSGKPFDLLTEIGRDCVGSIQLLPENEQPIGFDRIESRPLSDHQIAEVIRAAASPVRFGHATDVPFRISIAGAHEKTALLWHRGQWQEPMGSTPSTHIFKLPLGLVSTEKYDLSLSIENEWLCSRILAAYGFRVADCEIADFEDKHVLIVERFDRKLAESGGCWLRLPQEDLCQATGTPPDQKYESNGGPGIIAINEVLRGSDKALDDRREFLRVQIVFWMLCAIDGHAKNFSLFIGQQGRYRLTPFYDVLSAHPILGGRRNQLAPQKAKMAMAVVSKHRHYGWQGITRRHWVAMAKTCGLDKFVESMIEELIEATETVIASVSSALPDSFPSKVSEPIFKGLMQSARKLNGSAER